MYTHIRASKCAAAARKMVLNPQKRKESDNECVSQRKY